MSYAIFLDDYREISFQFKAECYKLHITDIRLVKNYDDFMAMILKDGCPGAISFDHDLADFHYQGDYFGEDTGLDCARFFIEYVMEDSEILPANFYWNCHSMNPVGKANIEAEMKDFLHDARQ